MTTSRIARLAGLFLAGSLLLLAQKRPMTPEDVLGLERVSAPQLSPDEQRVVYVVTRAELKDNVQNSDLWLVETRPGAAPARLTYAPKKDQYPRWSPDGKSIAFLSDRDGKMQVYLLPAAGGEARRLTNSETAVEKLAWAPDGRSLAFLAPEQPSPEEEKRKKEGFDEIVVDKNLRYAQLHRVWVESGKVEPLTRGRLHVVDFAWAPDGRRLAFTARPSPKLAESPATELYMMEVGSDPRRVTENNYAERSPQFSPDGRLLAFLSNHGKVPTVGPDAIHILESDGRGRVLNPDFPGYITEYEWAADGQSLYFSAGTGVTRRLFRTDVEGRALEDVTKGDVADTAPSVGPSRVAFVRETAEAPAQVFLLGRGEAPRALTAHNPQAAEWQLGRLETIRWKSKDGREIEGLLLYPVGYQPGKRYPLVVSVHGGPEGAYVRSFMATHGEFPHILAARGYACFFPNFRGSSNYGQEFAEANRGDVGGGDYNDIMSGVDYLVERGLADPQRLAVKGWSYGGYMSGWIIGHTDRFRVAVYGAGLSNAISYYGQADIQFSRENLHGGTPWTNWQKWLEQSPLLHLRNAKTPALIFHGEKDDRVPLPQSLETYRALKKYNVPVELVIYPREPHGLGEPKHQLDKIRRELECLDRYLKP